VSMTRTERRGFESERRTGIRRRMELGSARAAVVDRLEEALLGKNGSVGVEDEAAASAVAAARRAACRLR
jgi:hypothetical protein